MELSGQLHAPATLLSEKEPQEHFAQDTGCTLIPDWTAGNRTPVVQPVTIMYELSWLHMDSSLYI
jgi:hypothetical protein